MLKKTKKKKDKDDRAHAREGFLSKEESPLPLEDFIDGIREKIFQDSSPEEDPLPTVESPTDVPAQQKESEGAAPPTPKSPPPPFSPENYSERIILGDKELVGVSPEKVKEGENIFVAFPATFMHHLKSAFPDLDPSMAYVRPHGQGSIELNLTTTPYLFFRRVNYSE